MKDLDFINVDGFSAGNFCIGRYTVTQAIWTYVMGNNPSYKRGDTYPIVTVNYNDVFQFIREFSVMKNRRYRLPTEAEWEFAAKGGLENQGYKYSGSNDLDEVGWYYYNCGNALHPVGQKQPNELGIYDMSGNVWEMCYDNIDFYAFGQNYNVIRGGSWTANHYACSFNKIHCRLKADPERRIGDCGFRLVYDN